MDTEEDFYELQRFVSAQEKAFERALAELRAGKKKSHWIWYIFPQVEGLGRSTTAKHYAIRERGEAVAYLAHPILGARLYECTEALLQIQGRTIKEIMSFPDDLKLQSSMTLFREITSSNSVFQKVLDQYYDGAHDQKTLDFLQENP